VAGAARSPAVDDHARRPRPQRLRRRIPGRRSWSHAPEIERTRLDLRPARVTEAAVGYRRLTPVLAALAAPTRCTPWGAQRDASRKEAEGADGVPRRAPRVGWRVKLLSTRCRLRSDTVDIVTDLPACAIDESVARNVAGAPPTRYGGTAHWRPADVTWHLQAARHRVAVVDRGGRGSTGTRRRLCWPRSSTSAWKRVLHRHGRATDGAPYGCRRWRAWCARDRGRARDGRRVGLTAARRRAAARDDSAAAACPADALGCARPTRRAVASGRGRRWTRRASRRRASLACRLEPSPPAGARLRRLRLRAAGGPTVSDCCRRPRPRTPPASSRRGDDAGAPPRLRRPLAAEQLAAARRTPSCCPRTSRASGAERRPRAHPTRVSGRRPSRGPRRGRMVESAGPRQPAAAAVPPAGPHPPARRHPRKLLPRRRTARRQAQ